MFNFQRPKRRVGHTNAEGPPVPIPNTEVKLCSAESTMLETAWEGRSWPTPRSLSERIARVRDPHRKDGGVAQLGEHLPCKQGVMGSNPIISTKRETAVGKDSGDRTNWSRRRLFHRDKEPDNRIINGLIAQLVRARA